MIDAHVRFFDLDAVIVDDALLSPAERERVARKATPRLRQRQAASFQCVRTTLGDVLGVAPATLRFAEAEGGKPHLVGHALYFNVSHSGGVGMLAWGPREIGADVEALIARPSDGLAEEILSPRELEGWRVLPDTERQAWLTRVWTRKEAALKALGCGLRISPRTLDVADRVKLWDCRVSNRAWHGVDWLDGTPDGFHAAVCVEAPIG
jgi:4'-phosphopantetheinyl transferase